MLPVCYQDASKAGEDDDDLDVSFGLNPNVITCQNILDQLDLNLSGPSWQDEEADEEDKDDKAGSDAESDDEKHVSCSLPFVHAFSVL